MNRWAVGLLIGGGLAASATIAAAGFWVVKKQTHSPAVQKVSQSSQKISTRTQPSRRKHLYINGVPEGVLHPVTLNGQQYVSVAGAMAALGQSGMAYSWKSYNLNLHVTPETSYDIPKEKHRGNTLLLINGHTIDKVDIQEQGIIRYISVKSFMNILGLMHYAASSKKGSIYISIPKFSPTDAAHTGVLPGIHSHGPRRETWKRDIKGNFTVKSLSYNPKTNKLPIEGTSKGNRDMEVDISRYDPVTKKWTYQSWTYTIPVKDHHFSATIILPYKGKMDVQVRPALTTVNIKKGQHEYATFGMVDMIAYGDTFLSNLQIGQLQSFFINYNESSKILKRAKEIAQPVLWKDADSPSGTQRYDEIKAVSNWVSENIAYSWKTDASQTKRGPYHPAQTLKSRKGTNEDQDALTIALLRSLGIPSYVILGRATQGSRPNEEAHSWVEAWDGERWIQFDPTWDQVYNQQTTTTLPAGMTDTYFNPTRVFFTNHYMPVRIMGY